MYKVFPTGMIRIPLQKQEFYNKDYEDLINDKVFMEQLLVASPSLYDSVIDFDKCNEKKKQNVKVSLNSYSKRAAFRTTPFGIFTAINTVDLTKGTTSNVQKVSFIKKAVPDYSWIYSLVKSYEISNLEKLSLKINTAAFTQGDRYVLPFTVNESEEDRNISFSKPIKLLVEKCKTRYIKYEELIDVFKNNYPDIVSDMLESYIHDLVTNDFLISDLRPPICNINSLDYLLSKLEEGTLCTDLTTLKKMIEDYNDLNIGEGRDLLLQIFDKMESIYKYDNGGNYLKVDSLAEYEGDFNILSETARESIERLAEMFVKLNTNVKRRGGRKNSLEEYQLKFIGKYGENCSIPFVEVINKDSDLEILFKNINKYRFVSLRGIEQGESIFKDNLGNYNTEIVVPILKESNGINNTNDNVQFKNEVKKIYLPFCDWLFFKFYGPKERQEELLNNWKKFWLNLPSELFSQSNMFYMRYNDTNDHIRIRINCDSIENNFSLYLSVVQDLLPQLIESCIISDIEVSSYKPEVNRYRGPHLISYAEEIFCKESILFLNNTIEFSDDERLVCATYLVLYYLNHFFKDKETRRSFLFENYTGKYKKDFKNLPIDLPIEYMKILNGVTSALDRYDFFQEMDRYPMSYMKEYNRFGGTNDIYNTKFNLVGSFLHLSMNRLNGIDREFEEKVYCFAYYTLNAQQYIEWE
ncbi:TPA: thiopeptide-type bacteriocin biosynthesis protein [Streptococcus pyogenes]|nr:thiopeptide-type bacteriocin biosynthesis protein [Streptococcus pyogenes]